MTKAAVHIKKIHTTALFSIFSGKAQGRISRLIRICLLQSLQYVQNHLQKNGTVTLPVNIQNVRNPAGTFVIVILFPLP